MRRMTIVIPCFLIWKIPTAKDMGNLWNCLIIPQCEKSDCPSPYLRPVRGSYPRVSPLLPMYQSNFSLDRGRGGSLRKSWTWLHVVTSSNNFSLSYISWFFEHSCAQSPKRGWAELKHFHKILMALFKRLAISHAQDSLEERRNQANEISSFFVHVDQSPSVKFRLVFFLVKCSVYSSP